MCGPPSWRFFELRDYRRLTPGAEAPLLHDINNLLMCSLRAQSNPGLSARNAPGPQLRDDLAVVVDDQTLDRVSHPATATEPCSRRPSARAAQRRAAQPAPRMDPRQAAAAPREQSRHHPRPTRWDCAADL